MSDKYVWYACYGSNLLKERFMGYISSGGMKKEKGCTDKTPPIDERQILIPYELYFAKVSQKWNDCGVAFLKINYNRDIKTLGRAYLITEEQFKEVKKQEGGWYPHELELGQLDGWPIKTFTCNPETENNSPAPDYLDIIRTGLQETYPTMRAEDIDRYLKEHM